MQLDNDLGGALFTSPVHLIGFSRGTGVTSEISQRLGTYYPNIPDLQQTTLDPHDFRQDNLSVPLDKFKQFALTLLNKAQNLPIVGFPAVQDVAGAIVEATNSILRAFFNVDTVHYGDFLDPVVTVWKNVSFADNYWQKVPHPSQPPAINITPDGRPLVALTARPDDGIPTYDPALPSPANIDLNLSGRPGFTRDDLPDISFGGPHLRVKSWYAGTVALGLDDSPTEPASFHLAPSEFGETIPQGPDKVWRKRTERDFSKYVSFDGTQDNGRPWYRAQEAAPSGTLPWLTQAYPTDTVINSGQDTAPWEGIGEGWFYSVLGGGRSVRPAAPGVPRSPVTADNSKYKPAEAAVPSVFNGNFDVSIRPDRGRFPIPIPTSLFPTSRADFAGSWAELPGWSFHGGSGGLTDGFFLKTLTNPADLKRFFPQLDTSTQDFQNLKRLADGRVVLEDALPAGIPGFSWTPQAVDTVAEMGHQGLLNRSLDLVDWNLLNFFPDPIASLPLKSITHNRMYIPATANVLKFDTLVLNPGKDVQVQFELPDPSQPDPWSKPIVMSAGMISVSATDTEFQTSFLTIPDAVKGKMARLTFKVEDSVGILPAQVLLDNVELDGVVLQDDSGNANDDRVLMVEDHFVPPQLPPPGPAPFDDPNDAESDTPDPSVGNLQAPPPQSLDVTPDLGGVAGRDKHTVTIKNLGTAKEDVLVTVNPNDFLVYLPSGTNGSDEKLFNNFTDSDDRSLGRFTLDAKGGANDTLKLTFEGRLRPDYLNHLGTIEDQVLQAIVHVYSSPQGPSPSNIAQTLEPQDFKIFYVVDGADDSAFDKTLKLADTLGGDTRTLTVSRGTGVPPGMITLETTPLDTTGGTFTVDGTRIQYQAAPVADGEQAKLATALLSLNYWGDPLDPQSLLTLRSRATPRHVLNISVPDMKQAFSGLLSRGAFANFIQLFAPPGTGSVINAFDQNFDQFLDGFKRVFTKVYRTEGGVGTDELAINYLDTSGGGDVQFAFGQDLRDANGNPITSLGSAPLRNSGSYWTTFMETFYKTEQVVVVTGTDPTPRPAENYFSLASLRFMLDQMINPFRRSGFTLYVDNLAKKIGGSGSGWTPAQFGEYVGITAAHEFGHNIGFKDEYRRAPNGGRDPNFNLFDLPTLWSGTQAADILPAHKLSLGLAFNKPSQNVPLNADLLDDLIYNFWEEEFKNASVVYSQKYGNDPPPRRVADDGYELDVPADGPPTGLSAGDPDLLSHLARGTGAAPVLPSTQAPLVAAAPIPAGLVNGTFTVSDSSDPRFGWTVRGSGSLADGQALLREDNRVITDLSQTFILPAGAKQLRFTITRSQFGDNGLINPPDAFEAALLDAATGLPLVGAAAGLTQTDAFLNVQPTGEIFRGPQVTLSDSPDSSMAVAVDVSGVPAGTKATLYFDLLGFGPAGSSVVIRNVALGDLVSPPPPGSGGGSGGGGNQGGVGGTSSGGSGGQTGGGSGQGVAGTGGGPGGITLVTQLSSANAEGTGPVASGETTFVLLPPVPTMSPVEGQEATRRRERAQTAGPEENGLPRQGGYFDLGGGTDDEPDDPDDFWLWLPFAEPSAVQPPAPGKPGGAGGDQWSCSPDGPQARRHQAEETGVLPPEPSCFEAEAPAPAPVPSEEAPGRDWVIALDAAFAQAGQDAGLDGDRGGADLGVAGAAWLGLLGLTHAAEAPGRRGRRAGSSPSGIAHPRRGTGLGPVS